jgi:hypothetical protein
MITYPDRKACALKIYETFLHHQNQKKNIIIFSYTQISACDCLTFTFEKSSHRYDISIYRDGNETGNNSGNFFIVFISLQATKHYNFFFYQDNKVLCSIVKEKTLQFMKTFVDNTMNRDVMFCSRFK